jgi:hypothetical protein
MQQLNDHHQLTIDAFRTAIQLFEQNGKPLPDEISAIVHDLEGNIARLDLLTESHPDFETYYQTARVILQSQTGERNKRLTPTNGNGTIEQKADTVTPIAPPAANGKTPTPTESPPLKRFVLPVNATESEKQYFDQYIAQLKQLNPQWVVSLDYCNPGEAEAYIMIYKDDNYVVNHTMYSLDKFLARAFTRTFS